MQKITSVTELKEAIVQLEYEQAIKAKLLKEQVRFTLESLKPINIIKNIFNDVVASPMLIETILGYVTGYLSRRVFFGSTGGIIKKMLGNVIQFGVSKIVANNFGSIKSVGQRIGSIFSKK